MVTQNMLGRKGGLFGENNLFYDCIHSYYKCNNLPFANFLHKKCYYFYKFSILNLN